MEKFKVHQTAGMRFVKVLFDDGSTMYGGDFRWKLPVKKGEPAELTEVKGKLIMCKNGLHFLDAKNDREIAMWVKKCMTQALTNGNYPSRFGYSSSRATTIYGLKRESVKEVLKKVKIYFVEPMPGDPVYRDRNGTKLLAKRVRVLGLVDKKTRDRVIKRVLRKNR